MIKKHTEKLHSCACEKSNPLKHTQRGMQRNKATAFFEYYEEYKELKVHIFYGETHKKWEILSHGIKAQHRPYCNPPVKKSEC